jgi:hypothetical protein
MGMKRAAKLNWLERNLPEGLIVDINWLDKKGYSRALRQKYLKNGWLEPLARGVFRRPRNLPLTWEQVVVSLQNLMQYPQVVGGRTAIELQGYSHYLSTRATEIHLYGPQRPPHWLPHLRLDSKFVYHNSKRLFRNDPITHGLTSLKLDMSKESPAPSEAFQVSFTVQPWGQWNWPLTLSQPERALLELLDELPQRESFHQVDKLMEGLTNLSPRRLQKLLVDCRSVKVKRLFFFFADRHRHAWLNKIDKQHVDLGKGKRMLVKGGKLDPTYQITVPEDLDGVQ